MWRGILDHDGTKLSQVASLTTMNALLYVLMFPTMMYIVRDDFNGDADYCETKLGSRLIVYFFRVYSKLQNYYVFVQVSAAAKLGSKLVLGSPVSEGILVCAI